MPVMQNLSEELDALVDEAQKRGTGKAAYVCLREGFEEIIKREPRAEMRQQWTGIVGNILDRVPLDPAYQQFMLQSAGWRARQAELGDPLPAPGRRDVEEVSLWTVYLAAYFLRFEFKFAALRTLIGYAREVYPDETMLWAFDVFAKLGSGDSTAEPALANIYASDHLTIAELDTLLHGAWLSVGDLSTSDPMVRWVLKLSQDLIDRGVASANHYFWRATALRRSGRFADALKAVDDALRKHSLKDNHVHQDYVRERELIRALASIDAMITSSQAALTDSMKKVETDMKELFEQRLAETAVEFAAREREAAEVQRQRAKEADEAIQRSLTGVIEILGLFLALIGVLAGSGFLALNSDDWWRALVGVVALIVGPIVLLGGMRMVVRWPLERHARSGGAVPPTSLSPWRRFVSRVTF